MQMGRLIWDFAERTRDLSVMSDHHHFNNVRTVWVFCVFVDTSVAGKSNVKSLPKVEQDSFREDSKTDNSAVVWIKTTANTAVVFSIHPSGCSTDRSKVVRLLQFFFVRQQFHMAFVLPLFVLHFSFFSCLGKAVLRYCGIFWVPSFIILRLACVRKYFFSRSCADSVKQIEEQQKPWFNHTTMLTELELNLSYIDLWYNFSYPGEIAESAVPV